MLRIRNDRIQDDFVILGQVVVLRKMESGKTCQEGFLARENEEEGNGGNIDFSMGKRQRLQYLTCILIHCMMSTAFFLRGH